MEAIISFISGSQKSTTICLRGQLGNQLFQVALGWHLEASGRRIRYDLSCLDSNEIHILKLPFLHRYLEGKLWTASKYLPAPYGRIGFLGRILRRAFGIQIFSKNYSSHGKPCFDNSSNSLVDGYWQRNEFSSEFAKELKAHRELLPDLASYPARFDLVIHVRRGDFVRLGWAIDVKFYDYAISKIVAIHPEISRIVIVSDDYQYCLGHFSQIENIYVKPTGNYIDDFSYLASAKYLLTSRSTFSWWAGKLSDGFVFYPSPWDTNLSELDSELVPSDWIPISVNYFEQSLLPEN